MKKTFSFSLVLLLFIVKGFSQVGGQNTYKFLTIPTSARATMVGGSYNSIFDNDVSLAYQNPAVLNAEMHKNMSMNFISYYSGITFGNFNYVHDLKPATFQFGATFINYGKNPRYNIYGQQIGLTQANELAVNLGAGKSYKSKYKIGANAKIILSKLGDEMSAGMAFDLAAMWTDTAHLVNVSFNVTNLGFQFKPYADNSQEFLPLDVQISLSKRLKHVPFRIILTAHHLYTWDVFYDNPNNVQQNTNLFGGDTTKVSPVVNVIDNIARHLTLGGEIYIGKIITIGVGYNHLRRAELTIPLQNGLAGFSFGFGLKIKRFTLQYGFAKYALPQSVNHITLNVNLGESIKFKKRKKPSKENKTI